MGAGGIIAGIGKAALGSANFLPPLRQSYINEVGHLRVTAESMRSSGYIRESIARTVHQMRRDLGVKYKELTPPPKIDEIYERNFKLYHDKLAPSIEWLRENGKKWDQIIESACRAGGKDLGF